ncbi:MAG: UvrD-helicase domain-containing protein [Synergistaceae bacterium]|jgi:ATP-dependent exoDNAse (exonuclease V) beta subunit|nr:UvrD-helicase domain-containing protein [Synergistaceae bacterium]
MKTSEIENFIADMREEQRRAIRSLAPVTLVSASAGTGKTRTLANRFAWLLATDPECGVDQILTLTFTNAAAAEMRDRIRKTLSEWYSKGVTHLKDALERLDEAYISTIHAFALRVIRESGINLDIDPESRVVSEPMEREFWHDLKWRAETGTIDKMAASLPDEWREFARSLRENPSYMDFMNYYGAEALARFGRDACNLYGSMNMRPEYLKNWEESGESAARRQVESLTAETCKEVWDTWMHSVFDAIEPVLKIPSKSKLSDAMKGFMARWREHERTPEAEREFFVSLVEDALADISGKNALKEVISEYTGGLSDWKKSMKPLAYLTSTLLKNPPYGALEANTRDLLNGTGALFWKCWDTARRERGVLSFSDFARYAADTLAANPSYSLRFRHIMVDEFQDTDELQDSIARTLAESWPSGNEIPRTFFIVGDIKQSIYRFRHANPRLFAGYMKNEDTISMPFSYRMSGALMGGINMIFGHIWKNGVIKDESTRVDYEALMPPSDAEWWKRRNEPPCPEYPVEILLCTGEPAPDDSGQDPEPTAARRKKLALGLSSRLSELANGNSYCWDKELSDFRQIHWKDIAVLVRARQYYSPLEEAFAESGIPAVFGSGREYLNRGEARDLVGFVRLLDMPDDERALAGWMESPLSGLDPGVSAELARLAAQSGSSLRGVFEASYPETAFRLDILRRTARLYSPSRAVSALLEDESWLDADGGQSRGRALANMRRGIEMLQSYEASLGRNLSACADYLRREMRAGSAMEEPDILPDGADALKVMTIHAAKGLEFPVVVLMYMESSLTKDMRRGAISATRYLGAAPGRLPDGAESVRKKWHDAIERSEKLSESSRLLYVAMTRAQERLICCGLPGASGKKGEDWLSLLLAANENSGNILPVTHTGGLPEVTRRRPAAPAAEIQPAGQKNPAVPPAPRTAALSATAYSLISWCPVAYRMRYRQGREMKWERRGGDGTGGAELGTLAHWILSRWDFEPDSLDALLPGDIGADTMNRELSGIPPRLRHVWRRGANRARCREWLEAFAQKTECGILAKALKDGRLSRELAFSVNLSGINLIGSIDVFWDKPDGCSVRDWKITPEDGAPHEMYLAQIEFYAMACRIARGGNVDAGLIYLRGGEDEISSLAVENWAELKDKIIRAAETASGRKSITRGDCARCPFNSCCLEKNMLI